MKNLTHEVGHLLGGMHGDDNATTNFAGQPLVAYSHAFAFKSHWFTNRLQYATVMNAGEDNPRWKLNQFSNPNVTYDNFATGTTNRSHVARRIVETTPRIANYMPEPSVVIYIDGPRFLNTFGDYTFDAVTSCGNSSYYSWSWEISTDGFNYESVLGSNDIFTYHYSGQEWRWLKVTVVDGQGGRSSTAFKEIVTGSYFLMGQNNTAYSIGASRPIIDSSENQFRNVQVYPNPVQNTLNTRINISKNA